MGVFDTKKVSTQQHLDIEDIRDNLVVLKDGRVSAIIETTSLNFDLLDGVEQDARIGAFAAFLNSIRFPIQIVIKTQRTDIAKYLQLLNKYKQKLNSNEVINQVTIYQDFIKNLTQSTQVLDKRFYAVIPSIKLPIITTNWLKQMFGKPKKIVNISQLVQKATDELTPKIDSVIKQFGNLGIAARQLQNDELIKLYYSVYEPDRSGLDILNIREEDVEQGLVQLGPK
jgi:uncharacterized protein YkvS